nr:cytochrome P450 93A3-like [Coffea arabica]
MALMMVSEMFLFNPLLLMFLLFLAVSLFLSHAIKGRMKSKTPIQHPPSPPALPLIGHFHLLGPETAKSFQTLASRYGPILRLRLVSKTSVIVSSAMIAKEILKDNEMNFISRPVVGYSWFNIYDGSTFVFAEYGTYWRFMKKLCMTELLSLAQVSRFTDIRRDETMKLLETLVKCSYEGKSCDLGKEFLRLTNNYTCRIVMSTRCSASEDESKKVWEFIKEIEDLLAKLTFGEILGPLLGKLDLFGYGRKLKTLLSSFDTLVEKIMSKHEEDMRFCRKKERRDLMDLLLDVYRDENAEVKLTRKNIKALILELFTAGTETSAKALEWTIAELINHPQEFKKLKEEIHRVVGSQRLVEESDIPNLPYLRAVIRESLRLHPPSAVLLRRCVKDCKISGYDILANEGVLFNLIDIMRDPSSWENPLDFQPERFMEKSGGHYDPYQMDIRGKNFKMLAFGTGRRGCPGASLALAAVHGVIAALAQCFDFEVEGGKEIDMEEKAGLANAMAHPLLCYPITHFNPFAVHS